MPGDIQIERLEYLQQYASFLGNVRDSSLINFRDLGNIIDSECDDLHIVEQNLDAKSEDANKVFNKAHELQEQMNYPNAQSNHKFCELMESIDEAYHKFVREIELCEEKIQSTKSSLECIRENKNSFNNIIIGLIDKDIDIVKKSIDIIGSYISSK